MTVLRTFAIFFVQACGLNTFGVTDGQSASDFSQAGGDTVPTAGVTAATGGDTTSKTGDDNGGNSISQGADESTAGPSDDSTGCVPTTWYFDIDMDGYGGPMSTEICGGAPGPGYTIDSFDCDDTQPAVNPGAAELCDSLDNDCDGGIDEYPAGAAISCQGCRALLGEGSVYYFCSLPYRDWDAARAHCMTLLGDLAVLASDEEHDFVVSQAIVPPSRWWIGLGDSANESQFVWVDNSPLNPQFDHWSVGEPDNIDPESPGASNCVAIFGDVLPAEPWRDQGCTNVRSAVCEAPGF